ncbi:MAG: hypothetical protein KDB11_19250 [Planctomycetales bacterium]|nr:hypothetical protein [Planctomycetales bacterium]
MHKDSPRHARCRTGIDEQIERCVQFALRGAAPNRTHDERRRQKRHPFPYPVRLLPVNAQREAVASPIVVLGKHITSQGLDFYFQRPISHRRVIASFDCESPEYAELLMDLTWCRFSGHGWYENGGRFLSALNLPASNHAREFVPPLQTQTPSVVSINLCLP